MNKSKAVAINFGDFWPAMAAGAISVTLTDWNHSHATHQRRVGNFEATLRRGPGMPDPPIARGRVALVEFIPVAAIPPDDFELIGGSWMDRHLFLSPRRRSGSLTPYRMAFDRLRSGWGSMYRVVLADVHVYEDWRQWLKEKMETAQAQATL